ncbi:uncharacterized protein N7484_007767 [Penicillium longicatenatum]|uniref:uncharacterized protein n=1 Tax=Penicillium longicatenatum TaxID=1561947 RepID=UPI002546BC31|nr:uncharacterized protein N7484_007767 [Penicillium longicatenatum]KAJ5639905.1 hypothetical protein N7484_007767 [Penicillium longicatenatum]
MVQPSVVDLPPQLRLYPTCPGKKEMPKPLFYFPGLNPPPRRRRQLSSGSGSTRTGYESLMHLHAERKAIMAKIAAQRKVDIVRSNLLLASVPSPLLPLPPRAPVMAGILKASVAPRTLAHDRHVHFGEVKTVEVKRWMPQRPRSIVKALTASAAPRTSTHDRRVHFGEVEVVEVERWMQQRARKLRNHPCPPPACAIFPPIQKRVYQSWSFDPAALTAAEHELQHRPRKIHKVITSQHGPPSAAKAIGCGVVCFGLMLLMSWLKHS